MTEQTDPIPPAADEERENRRGLPGPVAVLLWLLLFMLYGLGILIFILLPSMSYLFSEVKNPVVVYHIKQSLLFSVLALGFSTFICAFFGMYYYRSSSLAGPSLNRSDVCNPGFLGMVVWFVFFNIPVVMHSQSLFTRQWPPPEFSTALRIQFFGFYPMGNLGCLGGFLLGILIADRLAARGKG